MNLLINAGLVCPPSDSLAFRSVTMCVQLDLKLSVLIITPEEFKDIYYFYMKNKGLLDFIDQFITPTEREDGIFIEEIRKHRRAIITDRIVFTNYLGLIDRIFLMTI